MTLRAAVMAAALTSASAFAQTAVPPASPAPAAPPAAATPAPHVTEQTAGQWLASKLPGVDVYNAGNEKIGDISELIMDRDGKISAVVVSVGGFLGMGKHDVAVPYAEVKWMDAAPARVGTNAAPTPTGAMPVAPRAEPQTTGTVNSAPTESAAATPRAYPHHAVVNMTADQLKAAPAFKYAR
jgi:sporulation protein YlmC with PRC-barrel domain